jgi:hypothetical protein
MARRLVEGRMRRPMVIEAVLRAMRRAYGKWRSNTAGAAVESTPAGGVARSGVAGRLAVLAALLSISFVIYMANGYSLDGRRGYSLGSGDSVPAALIPVTLALDGTVMLNRFADEEFRRFSRLPYWLIQTPRGTASFFPIATGVLATPILAVLILRQERWHPLTASAWRDLAVDRYQKIAAALLAALSVAVFWSVCRALAFGGWLALALTCLYAFGSEALAVSAQALWQHGPGSLAVLCLVRSLVALEQRPLSAAVCVGVFAGLAIAIRPNNLVLVTPLLIAGLHRRPQACFAMLLPALVVLTPVAAYNDYVFGHLLGAYALQSGGFSLGNLPRGMLGSLFSPARGLFIYFPAALLALVLVSRWSGFRQSDLARALAAGTVLLALLHGAWWDWSGGHSFGPRFFTETEGLMLLLLGMAFPTRPRAARVAAVALAAILPYSVMVQVLGAFSPATISWNSIPDGNEKARLWDFGDNPLLRGLRANLG